SINASRSMKGAAMKRCPNFRFLAVIIAALCLSLIAVSGFAQGVQTGNIYGKVQAKDGSVLPGVTVTLSGAGAPQTTVSDAQGNFRFIGLSPGDRKSTRLNSSHQIISYAVFCLKKKN